MLRLWSSRAVEAFVRLRILMQSARGISQLSGDDLLVELSIDSSIEGNLQVKSW